MNNKTKLKLNATLDKALETPKRKNLSNLDALLSQYESPDQTQTIPAPETNQTQTQTDPRPKQKQTPSRTAPIQDNKIKSSTAPVRDFNKRANSIDRDALPMGAFPGASKKIYDAIYLRTIGAVVPHRTIQATRREIMTWSGIQNIKTINAHLKRLKDSGLFKITNFAGEQTGSTYEIFLPEELGLNLDQYQTQTTQTQPRPEANQKMDSDQYQKMVWVGSGQTVENKDTSVIPNTSFKTIKNDDEAFAKFTVVFHRAVLEITGKNLTAADQDKLEELAELLVLELRTAARRTGAISNVPAFLTEVLRRKLLNQPVRAKSAQVKPDVVGKSESETFEIKPLDEQGREAALTELREFAGESFLGDFEKWYTPEDWQWLTKQMSKSSQEGS